MHSTRYASLTATTLAWPASRVWTTTWSVCCRPRLWNSGSYYAVQKLGVGARYSIVSSLFFIPYILLQLPSNIVLRKVGVINWLTFCVATWGVVQLSMGFIKSWGTLALCRTLLGILEVCACPNELAVMSGGITHHSVFPGLF